MQHIITPVSWWEAFEYLRESKGRALILGENDTGKTTLTTYLANELLKAGVSVSIVDADVGQSDVGPPTTVGLAEPKAPFSSMKSLPPKAMYFVGATSPLGNLLPLLVGVRKMMDAARGEAVLINTTGLIQGAGRALKTHKIEITSPNLLLALHRKDELEEILRAFSFIDIKRLEVPPEAKVKSPTQRRAERERLFRGYFQNSKSVPLNMSKVSIQRSYVGTPAKGQLCGLADGKNRLLALGVVGEAGVDTITVKTPVKKFLFGGPGDIRVVQLSKTYLD